MEQKKSAFISITGRPNVGKSTILNSIVGEKIAIVSDKPQTTRNRITGIMTRGDVQLVFLDTPGIHRPRNKLGEYMVKSARSTIGDVDIVVFVTDPKQNLSQSEIEIIESFKNYNKPVFLVINKIDLIANKPELLAMISRYNDVYKFDEVFLISAVNNQGIDDMLNKITEYAKPSAHFFPDDAITDQPEKTIISEIVREKILLSLDEEVPHGIAVYVERMREREDKRIVDIEVTIFCEKDRHKGIIIGKKGSKLKSIASLARVEIEAFLGIQINLQCWIKTKEGWRNRSNILHSLGYN